MTGSLIKAASSCMGTRLLLVENSLVQREIEHPSVVCGKHLPSLSLSPSLRRSPETALVCAQPGGMNSKLFLRLGGNSGIWLGTGDRSDPGREHFEIRPWAVSQLVLEIAPWGGILHCPHFPARGQITGVCHLAGHSGTQCHHCCCSAEARSLTLRECGVNLN